MKDQGNLYHLLRVSPDATMQEIRDSYKKLALISHPDKWSSSGRSKQEVDFTDIHYAYMILSDDEKRRMYDKHGSSKFAEEDNSNNSMQYVIFYGSRFLGLVAVFSLSKILVRRKRL